MKLELELTEEELAVLGFLVNADPSFGEPLKDIEDSYKVFENYKKDPYKAMKSLQKKLNGNAVQAKSC